MIICFRSLDYHRNIHVIFDKIVFCSIGKFCIARVVKKRIHQLRSALVLFHFKGAAVQEVQEFLLCQPGPGRYDGGRAMYAHRMYAGRLQCLGVRECSV